MKSLLIVSLIVCAVPMEAQTSRLWRDYQRVLITDYSLVQAVAANRNYYFAATTNGLIIRDHGFDQWLPPFTEADGFPRSRVTAMIADPSGEAVMIGTTDGLYTYSPSTRRLDRTSIPGGVYGLMFDRNDTFSGAYVRTSSGWEFLRRGSFLTERIQRLPPQQRRIESTSVSEVLQRYPYLDASRITFMMDERLRSYQFTSAAQVPGDGEVILGTNGRGIVEADPLVADATPLRYGLMNRAALSLFAGPRGIWVGAGPVSERTGITMVSHDLQTFEYEEGPGVQGFGRGIYALIGRGREFWVGTERGLVVFDPRGGLSQRLDIEIPGDAVVALAQTRSGVWVGSDRGLVFAADGAGMGGRRDTRTDFSGAGVTSLAAANDTAWVGTTLGLFVVAAREGELLAPRAMAQTLELSDRIADVVLMGDTVVAATERRLVWSADRTTWRASRNISELGRIRAIAPGKGVVWLGGDNGIAWFDLKTNQSASFTAPLDVPGRVNDLVVEGDYLWVAADGGLVRFELRALR